MSVNVNSRNPATRSFRRAAGTSSWGGIVENFSRSSFISASWILIPRMSASIFITAEPISVKGTQHPTTVRAEEYIMRLANQKRMAPLSRKIRSNVGSMVVRSSSVSLTSKTIRGSAAICLDSDLFHGLAEAEPDPMLPTRKSRIAAAISAA
jgi:hypothetical protein